jgi:hypothetical protein
LDPAKTMIKPIIIFKLLQKKLGFRTLMDVIPLDASLVNGSHGIIPKDDHNKPIFISELQSGLPTSAGYYF